MSRCAHRADDARQAASELLGMMWDIVNVAHGAGDIVATCALCGRCDFAQVTRLANFPKTNQSARLARLAQQSFIRIFKKYQKVAERAERAELLGLSLKKFTPRGCHDIWPHAPCVAFVICGNAQHTRLVWPL